MKESLILIICGLLLIGAFSAIWQEDLKNSADDLKAVKQYPMCATARIPRECGALLDKAK